MSSLLASWSRNAPGTRDLRNSTGRSLGIPGNVIAALVLGALLIQGILPGPKLYHNNPMLVFGFSIEMFLTSLLLFAIGGMAATRGVRSSATVTRRHHGADDSRFDVGVSVVNVRTVDLWVVIGIGIVAYLLEKIRIPLAPIVLGLILGPLAEQNVRRAMLIARNDWTELFTRPISALIVVASKRQPMR